MCLRDLCQISLAFQNLLKHVPNAKRTLAIIVDNAVNCFVSDIHFVKTAVIEPFLPCV